MWSHKERSDTCRLQLAFVILYYRLRCLYDFSLKINCLPSQIASSPLSISSPRDMPKFLNIVLVLVDRSYCLKVMKQKSTS